MRSSDKMSKIQPVAQSRKNSQTQESFYNLLEAIFAVDNRALSGLRNPAGLRGQTESQLSDLLHTLKNSLPGIVWSLSIFFMRIVGST